jgi:hypothetical protein
MIDSEKFCEGLEECGWGREKRDRLKNFLRERGLLAQNADQEKVDGAFREFVRLELATAAAQTQ